MHRLTVLKAAGCGMVLSSIATVLASAESRHQMLLFGISVTFFTNVLMLLYWSLALFTRSGRLLRLLSRCTAPEKASRLVKYVDVQFLSLLQRMGLVFGMLIGSVWLVFLGGTETRSEELAVNILLHYISPLMFYIDWLTNTAVPWPASWLPYWFAASAAVVLHLIGRFRLGHQLYWLLELEHFHILCIVAAYFVMVDIVLCNHNHQRVRRQHR